MSSPGASRYRATLAYDGTAYQGFRRQAGEAPTIQLAVERALAAITGQQITVIGAGRTDAGVHARGQVIAFDVVWNHDDNDLLRALNVHLPTDIAVHDIVQQPGFHPRFDALSRVYQYDIIQSRVRQPLLRYRAWYVHYQLDVDAMQQAAALLVGEHDFATFGKPPKGENTVRAVLESAWSVRSEPFGAMLVYRIEANAFLHRMVRRIVGMSVDVGRGARTLDEFEDSFRRARLAQAITVAPAHGLTLEAVRYR